MIKTAEELAQAQKNACEEIKQYDCRILVCSGTGCIATGSHKIHEIFSDLVKQTPGVELVFSPCGGHHDEKSVGVKKTGCQGFCELGPLVRIQKGDKVIQYVKVQPDDCKEILEKSVIGDEIIERLLYKKGDKAYVQPDEIPFIAKQTRIVLENCGKFDAESLDEYLAAGGFDANAEFANGEAAFYVNGSWAWNDLQASMKAEDLAMIPYYCGVEGEEKAGLCTGTENYWSVNKNAKEEDIKATLDFLYWVVTSEEGTSMMAEQFGACPFNSSKAPSNPFSALANEYVANGCYPVTWAFDYTRAVNDWRAGVVDALSKYTAGNGSWDDVKTAFVEGWATQYANENA